MITSIDHAQITIPKSAEPKAREFYCGFLGLKEIEKPDNRKNNGGFWLQLGELQVHVGTEDGVDRSKSKAHIAYRVDNLENWRFKLGEKGILASDSPPFPNARAFEFRDPFGNRVEFIQYF